MLSHGTSSSGYGAPAHNAIGTPGEECGNGNDEGFEHAEGLCVWRGSASPAPGRSMLSHGSSSSGYGAPAHNAIGTPGEECGNGNDEGFEHRGSLTEAI
jgi:hypothetical protein